MLISISRELVSQKIMGNENIRNASEKIVYITYEKIERECIITDK